MYCNYTYIKSLTGRRDPEISFISFEGTQQFYAKWATSYRIAKDFVAFEYERRRPGGKIKTTPDELRLALLSSMNANIFAYADDPSLGLKFPMIGPEDEKAGEVHAKSDVTKRMKEEMEKEEQFDRQIPSEKFEAFKKSKYAKLFGFSMARLYTAVLRMDINDFHVLEREISRLSSIPHPGELDPWLAKLYRLFRERVKLKVDRQIKGKVVFILLD